MSMLLARIEEHSQASVSTAKQTLQETLTSIRPGNKSLWVIFDKVRLETLKVLSSNNASLRSEGSAERFARFTMVRLGARLLHVS